MLNISTIRGRAVFAEGLIDCFTDDCRGGDSSVGLKPSALVRFAINDIIGNKLEIFCRFMRFENLEQLIFHFVGSHEGARFQHGCIHAAFVLHSPCSCASYLPSSWQCQVQVSNQMCGPNTVPGSDYQWMPIRRFSRQRGTEG